MSPATVTADEARHRLYEIMKGDESFEHKARAALELGSEYLGVDTGFVTRVDVEADHWETIVSTDGNDGMVPPGTKRDLGATYCRYTVERDSPLALHDTVDQGYAEPSDGGFRCYHGTTITVEAEPFGTVCFVGAEARTEPFDEAETMFAELVGRLLEHELAHQRQQEELARQTSLVNVLDRVLRHNIRNKMTVVRANARLHRQDHEECTECETIVEAADDLIEMSETARHLGKILNSTFDRQPIDLAAIVREISAEVVTGAPDAAVELDGPDSLVVSALPSLETAIWELVENAAEHAGPEPDVRVSYEQVDDGVVITVADDGPGLPATERDVLQTGTETPLVHGSGLGLWSVYWIVTGHSGRIGVESGDGTTITLTIPDAATDAGEGRTQIRRAGDRYRATFEQAPVGFVLVDEDGYLVELNDRAAALFDRSADELPGTRLSALPIDVRGPSLVGDLESRGPHAGTLVVETAEDEREVPYRLVCDVVPGLQLVVLDVPDGEWTPGSEPTRT